MSPIHEADESAGPLKLTVKTGDSQDQILILDSRGRLLERGIGPTQVFTLEQGIYRVKVLTGVEATEKVSVLTSAQTVTFEPARFVSPVPLAGTSSSHEYHMAAADSQSRKVHVAAGTGSSLFILVRNWTPYSAGRAPVRLEESPAAGLSLFAIGEHSERKLCDLTAGEHNLEGDAWAACTVAVDPGVYELRLELPSGDVLHQALVASPGWQTQAFLFVRAYRAESESSGPNVWRAELTRTSVHLSRGGGFSPNEPMLRTAELARMSLATRRRSDPGEGERRLMPDELRALLDGKFEDPMLGIYGAHLLLLERTVDVPLFARVVAVLRSMLGRAHPDVEALSLAANLQPGPRPFAQPPMLRRSWALLLNASVTRPSLVAEPLASLEPGRFLAEGPWHVWRSAAVAEEAPEHDGDLELSDLEAALAEDLGVAKAVRRSQRGKRERPAGVARSLETAQIAGAAPDLDVRIDEQCLGSIVRRYGMTPHQVKAALGKLATKMNVASNTPNLNLTFETTAESGAKTANATA